MKFSKQVKNKEMENTQKELPKYLEDMIDNVLGKETATIQPAEKKLTEAEKSTEALLKTIM